MSWLKYEISYKDGVATIHWECEVVMEKTPSTEEEETVFNDKVKNGVLEWFIRKLLTSQEEEAQFLWKLMYLDFLQWVKEWKIKGIWQWLIHKDLLEFHKEFFKIEITWVV